MTNRRNPTIREILLKGQPKGLTKIQESRLMLGFASNDPRLKRIIADGYSEIVHNLEKVIKGDLESGHAIEAYAFTDQYFQTVIKLSFPQIFFPAKFKNKISVEDFLRTFKEDKRFSDEYKILGRYRDFKSTRDDLVHKSLFSGKKVKGLFNQKKVEKTPFEIIDRVEHIFLKNISRSGSYFLKQKRYLPNDFLLIWDRVWKKKNKDLGKFIKDVMQISKRK